MAYEQTALTLVAGYPSKALYLYNTTDAISTVVASGYFNDAVTNNNLTTGDIIIARTGAAGVAAVDLLVAINTAGTVTVVNGT